MINGNKINKNPKRPIILITPLNWGLGHATRCIPIINELLSQDCEVVIAADGSAFSLLKKEFPALVFLRTNDYKIKYSSSKRWLALRLLFQFPKILFSIWKEHLWLKKIVENYNIDAVISDNRFGMYDNNLPSIYITHQLLIKTGNSFSEKFLQKLHYYFIKKYDYCWVPDFRENGLAGKLSHPVNIPPNILYIGPLSRFKKESDTSKVYEILISISGPEPQRSFFENKILNQIKNSNKKILFVRGLPGENNPIVSELKNTEIINHLPAEELNTAFQQSEIIVCRSGYTTIMDLLKINKKAVLVPTPGQTEQEYLSKYLKEKNYFYSIEQDNFSLNEDVGKAVSFSSSYETVCMDGYKKVIDKFVQSLKSGNFAPQ